MGGAPKTPKMGSQNGFDPQPYGHEFQLLGTLWWTSFTRGFMSTNHFPRGALFKFMAIFPPGGFRVPTRSNSVRLGAPSRPRRCTPPTVGSCGISGRSWSRTVPSMRIFSMPISMPCTCSTIKAASIEAHRARGASSPGLTSAWRPLFFWRF